MNQEEVFAQAINIEEKHAPFAADIEKTFGLRVYECESSPAGNYDIRVSDFAVVKFLLSAEQKECLRRIDKEKNLYHILIRCFEEESQKTDICSYTEYDYGAVNITPNGFSIDTHPRVIERVLKELALPPGAAEAALFLSDAELKRQYQEKEDRLRSYYQSIDQALEKVIRDIEQSAAIKIIKYSRGNMSAATENISASLEIEIPLDKIAKYFPQ